MPAIDAGPFGAVVDATDPNEAKLVWLFDAVNMTVPDPVKGSAVLARHGFLGFQIALGVGLLRRGQGMLKHRRLDGTLDRFVWAGGRMYRWDGVSTCTDITPAGISIDPENPIFAMTFEDEVIVSDENNKPWIYTPATGAAVTIAYNASDEEWTTKGGPRQFDGCVFFIVKTVGSAFLLTEDGRFITTEDDRLIVTEALTGVQNTVAWSRPLDARLGYDQANDDNTWTLTQSSSDLLGALFTDETALTYLRNKGIGYITGKVQADFQTSSDVDAVDGTIGTDAPAGMVVVNRKAWFVDLEGRVHRVAAGGAKPEELWRSMRRAVDAHVGTAANNDNVIQYARAAYHSGLKVVLFTIWDPYTLYAFDANSGSYLGTWSVADGIAITAMGEMADASGRTVFLLMGTRTATDTPANHGVLWRQKFPDDVKPWLDQPDASVATYVAPPRAVEPSWLAHKAAAVFRAVTTTVSLVGDAVAHTIGLRYTVPASGQSRLLTAMSSAVLGVTDPRDTIASAAWTHGRNAQGSAIRLRISAEDADDYQFGINELSVDMQVTKARANAK